MKENSAENWEAQLSPEWKARLEKAKRIERRSTIALIVAVIALLFS